MRWLSFSVGYAHEVVGGTEAYVHRLNVALRRRSVEAFGAYFTENPGPGTLDGVPLFGLPAPRGSQSRLDHWSCVPRGLDDFRHLLADVRPDVVHFHAALQMHAPEFFELARGVGATTLWTFHSQGQTCLQTALLRNGTEQCDGFIEPGRCARCGLVWSGLPRPVAALFGTVDLSYVSPLLPARLGHPFERRQGVVRFLRRLKQACASLDHWVVHARWVRELLALNGLDRSVLDLPLPPPEDLPVQPDHSVWEGLGERFRLLYVGRLQDQKGPQIPVQALWGPLNTSDICVGLLAPPIGSAFEARLRDLVAAEPRARMLAPRGAAATLAAMASADAVVVPSVWRETGPYTVLEAQWVGTPVIGARLGGIAERLQNDDVSIAYDPSSPTGFSDAALQLMGQRPSRTSAPARARRFRDAYIRAFDSALDGLLRAL